MSGVNNQFRIDLPDGWEDQTAHTFTGPEVNGVPHLLTLVIDSNVAEDDLAGFAEDRIQRVKETLPSAETLKEEERTLPSGMHVYEWVYRWVPTDDQVLFKKHVYAMIAKKGYIFSATFSKHSMQTIGVEVEQMIDSLRPALT